MSHTPSSNQVSLERIIASTLAMQSGFPKSAITQWTKILGSALASFSGDALECSQTGARTAHLSTRSRSENEMRLEAVVDFSRFLLSKGTDESTPNEYALEGLVNSWNSVHNEGTILPDVKRTELEVEL